MRRALILLTFLSALVLVPPALGACLPLCAVESADGAGFLPPVVVVTSGEAVTWRATDNVGHTATDRADFCFHVGYTPARPGTARFDIVGDLLVATSPGAGTAACNAATRTPDGSFVLDYTCLFHPSSMNAKLVVLPVH